MNEAKSAIPNIHSRSLACKCPRQLYNGVYDLHIICRIHCLRIEHFHAIMFASNRESIVCRKLFTQQQLSIYYLNKHIIQSIFMRIRIKIRKEREKRLKQIPTFSKTNELFFFVRQNIKLYFTYEMYTNIASKACFESFQHQSVHIKSLQAAMHRTNNINRQTSLKTPNTELKL